MESTINERIIAFLKANNVTISKLADVLGTSQSTLSNKLCGRYRVDVDTLVQLLTIYEDLSADWLLLGREPMLRSAQVAQSNINGDNINGDNAVINKESCDKFIEMLKEKDRQIAELIDIIKHGTRKAEE